MEANLHGHPMSIVWCLRARMKKNIIFMIHGKIMDLSDGSGRLSLNGTAPRKVWQLLSAVTVKIQKCKKKRQKYKKIVHKSAVCAILMVRDKILPLKIFCWS